MTPAPKRVVTPLLIIAGSLLVLGGALLYYVPSLWDPFGLIESRARIACAEEHLQAMYVGLKVYIAEFGSRCDPPPHRGPALWLCLAGRCGEPEKHAPDYAAKAPLANRPEVFLCPSCGGERATDYLGPRPYPSPGALPSVCPPGLPIAADRPANHKGAGGNVLFFDGSVRFLEGAEYEAALKRLEPTSAAPAEASPSPSPPTPSPGR